MGVYSPSYRHRTGRTSVTLHSLRQAPQRRLTLSLILCFQPALFYSVHLVLEARKAEGEQLHSCPCGFDTLADSWSRYKPAASQGPMQNRLSRELGVLRIVCAAEVNY